MTATIEDRARAKSALGRVYTTDAEAREAADRLAGLVRTYVAVFGSARQGYRIAVCRYLACPTGSIVS